MILSPQRAASATEAGSPVKNLKGRDGRDLIPGKFSRLHMTQQNTF